MTLADIVQTAGGLSIAQRGARNATGADLRVSEVGPVDLPDGAPMLSRRADESVWRRHWSLRDRLVIDFVDVVSVEIDESTGSVVFDRALDRETEQHLLLDHVLPLVLARRGKLVLHGGVISIDGLGVVLAGMSGAGKSTLTAFALQQGWTVGGDDGAVVRATEVPTVEPTYPTIRLNRDSAEMLDVDTSAMSAVAGKMRVVGAAAARFRQKEVTLKAVAFIEPRIADQPAEFIRLDGIQAHAQLFGSTFHAELAAESSVAIMHGLSAVVASAAVGVLHVPRGIDGLRAAEAELRRVLSMKR